MPSRRAQSRVRRSRVASGTPRWTAVPMIWHATGSSRSLVSRAASCATPGSSGLTVVPLRASAVCSQLETVPSTRSLGAYVQAIADADVENGAAIIGSSGLLLRKMPVRKPRVAAVKPGAMSGSVEVVAPPAARRAAYEWQYSLDGGKTWVEASPSLQAKQTIVGLPVGSSVMFRYRAVVKTGPLDWGQPIALLVK